MRSLAMQSLTKDISARHPGVTIWGVGDEAHKLHASDHNEDDTAGSKAAQSDSDSNPEHRAIDVKVDGVALTRDGMLAIINEVLADPKDRERLIYINFENTQWSEKTDWKPIDNSDDPHPTHGHFSGKASKDEDGSPWLGDDMSWNENLTAGVDAGGGTYPAKDWLIGANWKAWDSWENTEILKAEQAEQTAMIQQLLTMVGELVQHGGGSVDTAAILRGVDERLSAQREHIKATAEAHRKRIEDAIADLGEGGAAKVRSEIDSEQ